MRWTRGQWLVACATLFCAGVAAGVAYTVAYGLDDPEDDLDVPGWASAVSDEAEAAHAYRRRAACDPRSLR